MTIPDHTLTVSTEQEEWRSVIGYEGWYEVSSFGRVRRLMPSAGHTAGNILAWGFKKSGYPQIHLYRSGKSKCVTVHQLVAAAFIGSCPEGYEVNHKDRNRGNPRADNLEYKTHLENMQYSRAAGSFPQERVNYRGEQHYAAKLTVADVLAIRDSTETQKALAVRYGVSTQTIWAILRRKKWKHVA